jgi:hypothetical protein
MLDAASKITSGLKTIRSFASLTSLKDKSKDSLKNTLKESSLDETDLKFFSKGPDASGHLDSGVGGGNLGSFSFMSNKTEQSDQQRQKGLHKANKSKNSLLSGFGSFLLVAKENPRTNQNQIQNQNQNQNQSQSQNRSRSPKQTRSVSPSSRERSISPSPTNPKHSPLARISESAPQKSMPSTTGLYGHQEAFVTPLSGTTFIQKVDHALGSLALSPPKKLSPAKPVPWEPPSKEKVCYFVF